MELKEKIQKIKEKSFKTLNDDSDVLTVVNESGNCGAIMKGNTSNIAHSIFTLIHSGNKELSDELYYIIKLVTLNIINNESAYALDLVNSILNVIPSEQIDEPLNDGAVFLNINYDNEQGS